MCILLFIWEDFTSPKFTFKGNSSPLVTFYTRLDRLSSGLNICTRSTRYCHCHYYLDILIKSLYVYIPVSSDLGHYILYKLYIFFL